MIHWMTVDHVQLAAGDHIQGTKIHCICEAEHSPLQTLELGYFGFFPDRPKAVSVLLSRRPQ